MINDLLNGTGCDACLGRREFLQRSALFAAAAAALAACAPSDATGPSLGGMVQVKVTDYPALANVGGIATLTTSNGSPIAVVRTGAESFVALSRVCPHQGATVNSTGSGFFCPGHGAQFSDTGVWQGGQPTSNLHAYATSYDAASGVVTISP
jgi:cytochrome b6-f complex iron-sulfur subunit